MASRFTYRKRNGRRLAVGWCSCTKTICTTRSTVTGTAEWSGSRTRVRRPCSTVYRIGCTRVSSGLMISTSSHRCYRYRWARASGRHNSVLGPKAKARKKAITIYVVQENIIFSLILLECRCT